MIQQVLELSETKNSCCVIRAWGWKLHSILRRNKQLIGSQNNEIPNCIIHGLVHNNVCDKAMSGKIQSRTSQWIWTGQPHTPLQQPASQLLHATVRVWRHLRKQTYARQQALSAKTLQVFDLSASVNEIYWSEYIRLRLIDKLYHFSTLV